MGDSIRYRLLRVNLTTKEVKIEDIPLSLIEKYIGGRGLGAYFLTKEVLPNIDPLSEENKLIFFNGPLSGTVAPGNNKVNVTFKSPLTNTYSYALAGGHWGPELRFAGFLGLIVEGKSESPVYLFIDDENVKILDADFLWGKDIRETDEILKEKIGDSKIHIASIGPAGENLVKYACITNDVFREFGRGGSGAVMGSKNLKAIIVRGSGDVQVHDTKGLIKLAERIYPNFKEHPKAQIRRKYGTNELVETINNLGFMCTKNNSLGTRKENKVFEGENFRKSVVKKDAACYACPIACSKNCIVESKEHGEIKIEGPEFETVGLLGTNCGLDNWEDLLRASSIADSLGIDTISGGGCIALAMECYEKGIITEKDTNGLELKFGNVEAECELLRMIAYREGIGDILADGPLAAASKWGVPELAIQSKGLTPAVYDPRGAKGMGLTYATSPKGAHHMVAPVFGGEIAQGNRLEEEGKEVLVKNTQLNFCFIDSLSICSTIQSGFGRDEQIEAFNLVTGLKLTEEEMLLKAERIWNMERMFNVKNGFTRKNDTLPKRFTKEPMPTGESKGQVVNLEPMLDKYYDLVGWDKEGIPLPEKLKELGI